MNSVAKIRQRLMQDWGTHWPFQLRFQIFCDKKEVRRCGTTLYKYLDLGFSRHQQHLWLSVLAFFTPEGFDATPMLEEAWEEAGELCLGSRIYPANIHISCCVPPRPLVKHRVFQSLACCSPCCIKFHWIWSHMSHVEKLQCKVGFPNHRKIGTCLAWFSILSTCWTSLWIFLWAETIPLRCCVQQLDTRISGDKNWELNFSWRLQFCDADGWVLCEKKCVFDIWCKNYDNNIYIYTCIIGVGISSTKRVSYATYKCFFGMFFVRKKRSWGSICRF